MADNAIHLHHSYGTQRRRWEPEFEQITIGIALCGAQKLPRGRFVLDLEAITCPHCAQRAKAGPPKPPPQPPISPPATARGGRAATPHKGRATPAPAPANGRIVAMVQRNPRKQGTAKHARMALLLQHNGKTVAEFAAAGGNLETLKNAIKESIVEVRAQ
jgi:hypothetical protein